MEQRRLGKPAPRGFVTLYAVLIILFVGITLAFSSLLLSGHSEELTEVVQASLEAQAYADACAEMGLLEVRDTGATDSSGSESFAEGECAYSIVGNDPLSGTIESTGTAHAAVRKIIVDFTLEEVVSELGTTTAISNTVWAEVADF
jgi:Tfp pilus assembly protein PilX